MDTRYEIASRDDLISGVQRFPTRVLGYVILAIKWMPPDLLLRSLDLAGGTAPKLNAKRLFLDDLRKTNKKYATQGFKLSTKLQT